MDTSGTNLVWIIAALVDFAIKIAALIIIPRRRKPTAAMAWLLAIFLIPYVGIILYLLIGSVQASEEAPRRAGAHRRRSSARTCATRVSRRWTDSWPRWFQRVVQQNEKLTGIPASFGNQATLLGDYQGSIDAMAAEIDTATHLVHVEFFIVAWDDTTRGFFSAMERAVARGVTVRLLADHLPSAKIPGSKETFAELDRIGVKWSWMLPVQLFKGKYQRPDLRNHRKLVVVDGRVGFMGSQNLIARTLRLPEEHQARPAVAGAHDAPRRVRSVAGVNTVFLSDWFIETGERLTEHVPVERDRPLDRARLPAVPGRARAARLRRPRTTSGCSSR